jgi:metallophosphoesterase superfamily enzyme
VIAVAAASMGDNWTDVREDCAVRTLIVSDLHLGAHRGDLIRHPRIRETLLGELSEADQLVLLGDVVELRDLPLGDAIELARPLFEEVAEALDGGRILVVPGNHDHQIASPLIERHRLRRRPLALEQRFSPVSGPLAGVARRIPAEVEIV